MDGFASSLLEGATLEVETVLSPPIRVSLAPDPAGDGPGLLSRLLRPRYTLRAGNLVLPYQPSGDPSQLRITLAIAAALVLLVVFIGRR